MQQEDKNENPPMKIMKIRDQFKLTQIKIFAQVLNLIAFKIIRLMGRLTKLIKISQVWLVFYRMKRMEVHQPLKMKKFDKSQRIPSH